MASLEGDLTVMSAPDVVIWLANRRKTGELVLERENEKKGIVIEQGNALSASTNDPREFLGQFLVNFGLATEDQLQRAFEAQKETKVLLGRILCMIGTCTEDQVKRTLDRQIREVVHSAMQWSSGHFVFTEQESIVRPEGDLGVSVPLLEIHREGAKRVQHWSTIRTVFPNDDTALTVHEERIPPTARPETFDGRIIALAKAGLTVEGIKLDLHSTDFHFFARLYELYRKGIVEPRETGPLQALETGNLPPESGDEVSVDKMPDQVPQLSGSLEEILRERRSAKERYILTRVDGSRTVQSIIQISPMREQEGFDIFRKLQQAGLIRF